MIRWMRDRLPRKGKSETTTNPTEAAATDLSLVAPVAISAPEPPDRIKTVLPDDTEFDGFEGAVVETIPKETDNPEEVPERVYAAMAPLFDRARQGVNNALDSLQEAIEEYRAKLRAAQTNFTQAVAAAKDQLLAEAKPELATLRTITAAKAKEITALRQVKAELPQQIEDAEFANTGDPRIRVGYISQEMKSRMAAATALITTLIGGIDLVLASVVFVTAADETTGWVIGGAYALLLGLFMHQSAHYGRQVDANEEAQEAFRYHLEATPNEKRKVRSLSEIVLNRARRNYNSLWITGVSMAAIRLLIAAITGEWKGSAIALVITVVAFAIALAGVELLKKFMAPFGDQHQVVGNMKARLGNIDSEIAQAENREIVPPQGLASAKAKYGKNIKLAQDVVPANGKALIRNGQAILTSEAKWFGQAKERFSQACMATLEQVVTETPAEPIEEAELLTHFEATGTNHPLVAELNRGVVFGGIDTTAPTADAVIAELDRNTPVPPPEPVKPAPRAPVKLVLKKVRK